MKILVKNKNGILSFIFGKPKRSVVKRTRLKKSIVMPVEREAARALVHARLEHFNQHYNFSYNKVAIRNQKTRWGSCSNKGNLNFSVRILMLAPEAQDYLVVHELCHLKEFNHSQAFWDLVAQQVPEYKRIRQILRYTAPIQ